MLNKFSNGVKTKYSLVFFILILLAIAIIFFFLNKQASEPTLRDVVSCYDKVIDDSVLNLDDDTILIGAFITFKSLPLDQATNDRLLALNVVLDQGSQLFEISPYLLAEIPTSSLCELAKIEAVVSIFIPAMNNET